MAENVDMNNVKKNNGTRNNRTRNNRTRNKNKNNVVDPYVAFLKTARTSMNRWLDEFSADGPWKTRERRLRRATTHEPTEKLPRNRSGMLRESIRQLYTEMTARIQQVQAEYEEFKEGFVAMPQPSTSLSQIQQLHEDSKTVSKRSRRILKEIIALYQAREAANHTSLYENNTRARRSKWNDPLPAMPAEHRRLPMGKQTLRAPRSTPRK